MSSLWRNRLARSAVNRKEDGCVHCSGAITGKKRVGTAQFVVPVSAGVYLGVGPEPELFGRRTAEVV